MEQVVVIVTKYFSNRIFKATRCTRTLFTFSKGFRFILYIFVYIEYTDLQVKFTRKGSVSLNHKIVFLIFFT